MRKRTTALVLAAGTGSRFGGGKLLASLQGKPLLQHVLDRVAEAGLGEAVVVLGHDADAVEHAIAWRSEQLVRNPAPERGLASSLQAGMAAVDPTVDAVLILLGDQPLVAIETIRALLDAPGDSTRPIVVPAYSDQGDQGDHVDHGGQGGHGNHDGHGGHGGRNPLLLQRAAFGLTSEATGDRGLGPVLEAHPELVVGVPITGGNPDVDTPDDLARVVEASWAMRVRANREQVERIREVADETDFYAPVQSLFRSDPTRIDDPVLLALVDLIRPGETWLDVGAGAGRFALPIARALDPSGGSVLALDASPSMLESLREIADDYAIENVRTIEARWPLADPSTLESDVTLIAHVGYDIDAIGAFVDGLETAARRVCVAVLMERVPASAADPFWPRVHGEPRVALPALPDFVELLRARGREPAVTDVVIEPRHLESRGALEAFVRRQLWIDPAGPKEATFQAAVDELAVCDADGWTIRDRAANDVGIVMWTPPG